jgi:CheY-like chemotaxis protein
LSRHPNDQTSLREGVRSEKCQKGFRRDLREATPLAKILIVSDINMPGMSGLELLPKAKAARPDVPVIMITAYADDNTKRKALEGGADALTLLFDRRAYGTENLSPMPQKDFCNTICHKQTSE